MSYSSETSAIRAEVLQFIGPEMNGLDLGAGGDPIMLTAIALDLPQPYAHTHDEHGLSHPHQLRGNARRLEWFRDGSMDYIYSSHLLEDFPNTTVVIAEWLRVLKSRGKIILYLPDEQKYRVHCARTGQPYNSSHECPEMSRKYMEDILRGRQCSIAHSIDHGAYSFLIVAVKP